MHDGSGDVWVCSKEEALRRQMRLRRSVQQTDYVPYQGLQPLGKKQRRGKDFNHVTPSYGFEIQASTYAKDFPWFSGVPRDVSSKVPGGHGMSLPFEAKSTYRADYSGAPGERPEDFRPRQERVGDQPRFCATTTAQEEFTYAPPTAELRADTCRPPEVVRLRHYPEALSTEYMQHISQAPRVRPLRARQLKPSEFDDPRIQDVE